MEGAKAFINPVIHSHLSTSSLYEPIRPSTPISESFELTIVRQFAQKPIRSSRGDIQQTANISISHFPIIMKIR